MNDMPKQGEENKDQYDTMSSEDELEDHYNFTKIDKINIRKLIQDQNNKGIELLFKDPIAKELKSENKDRISNK